MKKTLIIIFLATIGFIVKAQTAGDYQSVTTGDWSATTTWAKYDGMNWNTNPSTAPNSLDGVISIKSGHIVTLGVNATVDQLIVDEGAFFIHGATLTLADGTGDDLTVNGTENWPGGELFGPGNVVITSVGSLIISANNNHTIGANIVNNGSMDWQGNSTIFENGSPTITNNSNWTISGNGGVFTSNLAFINTGTITKISSGVTDFFRSKSFNNSGTINCNAGIFTSGQFSESFINTGNINVAAAGQFTNNAPLTNTGNITVMASTFTNNGTINHNTGSIISGTGNFNNNGTLNLNIDQTFPSTFVFPTSGNIKGPGNLLINNDLLFAGEITGSGTFVVNGNVNWTIGNLARSFTNQVSNTFTISTSINSNHTFNANLINNGTFEWQAGPIHFGDFNPNITNNGLWKISANNGTASVFGIATIINTGTITKTSSGLLNINRVSSFTNSGTINCNAGDFTYGPNCGALISTGNVFINGGTFTNNAIFNHNVSSVISGTGNFNNNGTMNLNIDQVFPSTLIFASFGKIDGVGHLTVNNDFVIAGEVTGAGTLTINANSNWIGGLLNRLFTNTIGNTFVISTNENHTFGKIVTNEGTMDWQGNSTFFESGSPTLINNANWIISGNGGVFTSSFDIINTGIITKTSVGSTDFFRTRSFNNSGTINCNAGNFISPQFTVLFTNTGNILVDGGVFTNNGPLSNSGNVIVKNGPFTNNATFTNNSTGIISGTGTFITNGPLVNNGKISPGLSPGKLILNGTQPFSANSTLQIELQDGSGEGIGHDLLERVENLTLAGTLTVIETGTPPAGSYTIIKLTPGATTISGNFTTLNLPLGYTIQVNSKDVQLIKAAPLPLTLLSFSGKSTEVGNKLTWKTTNETNFSHFEIQRSNDAKKFENIGEKPSNESNNYEFQDSTPPSGRSDVSVGGLFYRLKLIDLDDKYYYSKIIRVENETEFSFSIYPNPVIDNLNISANLKESGNYQIQILNEIGQVKSSQNSYLKAGQNQITLSTNSWQKGLYFAVIQGDRGVNRILKFVK